jgi:polyhydroxyalkanoate synthesis regulator phasin
MNDGTHEDPDPNPAPAHGGEERDEALLSQLAGLRKALAQSVVVTGERVQETVEDAVRRGRMTRRDAQELASAIVAASRRQTDEIRQELEALLRGRGFLGRRDEASPDEPAAVSIPIQRDDPPVAPLAIRDYDDLTAVLVRRSLAGLSPDELRAVREHEAAHANRKTVLAAVDRLLGPA